MQAILFGILGTMIGPISALVTTRLMDFIDNVLKLTDGLPATTKQLIVMALAAIVPVLNSHFGVTIPTDYQSILSQPDIQYIVGLILAFVLKGHAQVVAVQHTLAATTDTKM